MLNDKASHLLTPKSIPVFDVQDLPPLIVRVNVPHAALHKDLVLVHREQDTQRERGKLLNHDGVAGSVALENLNWISQNVIWFNAFIFYCNLKNF